MSGFMTLDAAAKIVPGGRSKTSLFNWHKRGVRGVRLKCWQFGRTLYTTADALQAFAERLANAMQLNADADTPDTAAPAVEPVTVQKVASPNRADSVMADASGWADEVMARAGLN